MDRPLTRLLVIYPGALGDTLVALPVLAALKQSYAPAVLELIGHPALLEVLPGRSAVDRMRSIEGPEFHALLGDLEAIPRAQKALFEMCDVAIAWVPDSEGQLKRTLTKLRIPCVIVRSPGLREPGPRHAMERFRDTLSELDRPIRPTPATLIPTDLDLASGRTRLIQAGLDPAVVPVVAVHPGSGSPFKCWPADRFADLIRELLRQGAGIVVLEGPADSDTGAVLTRLLAPLRVPRLTNCGLATVVRVLAHCRAFVGNDSGLTHLAAALGIPTICVWGPTDPAVWAPWGNHVLALRGDAECRCPKREDQLWCLDRVCLSIPVQRVQEALQHTVFDAV